MNPLKIIESYRPWVAVLFFLLLASGPLLAETVHLTTGEIIKGKIVRVEEETISIESNKGFGIIQINRTDILLIEFEESQRDFSRLFGIGYYHRSVPASVAYQAVEYGMDAVSMKMWVNQFSSLDFMLGFYSADTATSTSFRVLSLDIRFASVFERRAHVDLYYGASAGLLSVTDSSRGVDDTGISMRAFLGVELFFITLPSLGIASEISFGTQTVGDSSVTNISTSTFPAFSIRYYF